MEDYKKIAITGGIGSGKSTVLQMVKDLGYPVVSLDEVYSELLSENSFVIELSKMFGISPILQNGKCLLDRKALSEKVFNDKNLLKSLNEFTHGKIFERAMQKAKGNLTFYEVPLLFEGNYQDKFDNIWIVMRDYEQRIASASLRDGCSKEQIELKAKNQFDYEKNDLSLHTIISNDGTLAELEDRVKRAIGEIKTNK